MTLVASLSWPLTPMMTFRSLMKLSVHSAMFSSSPMFRIFRRGQTWVVLVVVVPIV